MSRLAMPRLVMSRLAFLGLATALLAHIALPPAAFAQDTTLTCPLDGQVITVADTSGCTFSGQTMDGRPITACDTPALMPDCTDSGLPLYKTFDAAERAALAKLVVSDPFDLIRDDSRFERAYWLERRLRPDGPHNLALFILLDAYRDDPAVADTDMMEHLEATASRMAKAQPEDPATLLALSNTAAWHAYAGRTDKAREWLDRLGVAGATARGAAFLGLDTLRAAKSPDDPAITQAERAYRAIRDVSLYGDTLQACLDDLTADGCHADDPVKN